MERVCLTTPEPAWGPDTRQCQKTAQSGQKALPNVDSLHYYRALLNDQLRYPDVKRTHHQSSLLPPRCCSSVFSICNDPLYHPYPNAQCKSSYLHQTFPSMFSSLHLFYFIILHLFHPIILFLCKKNS